MRKVIFKYNILRILILSILILFFGKNLANGEITYRSIEGSRNFSITTKVFEVDSFFGRKSTLLVDMQKKPLFIIPDDKIAKMTLSYNVCVDISSVSLGIDLREDFSELFKRFTTKFSGQKIAIFIGGDFWGAPSIDFPMEKSFAIGPQSYEQVAAIIINSGYIPNYEETCVGGKTKIIDLIKKYKFNEHYVRKQYYYPSALNNSEFWYVKEDTPIYDSPSGKKIARMPAKKIVQQHYNSNKHDFERNGDWLAIMYQGEVHWIKGLNIVPFFSILDTNLFLQKFFVYNEYRYEGALEDKHMYSADLIERISSLRKLYVKEALARFKDEKEFYRWYGDTFKKTFEK